MLYTSVRGAVPRWMRASRSSSSSSSSSRGRIDVCGRDGRVKKVKRLNMYIIIIIIIYHIITMRGTREWAELKFAKKRKSVPDAYYMPHTTPSR